LQAFGFRKPSLYPQLAGQPVSGISSDRVIRFEQPLSKFERIANVPLDVIMQDYLLSNVYRAQAIRSLKETLRAQDGDALAAIQEPLLGVQESFLQAGFDQVQTSYGTMTRYLTDGLGVSEAAIESLRSRLVV